MLYSYQQCIEKYGTDYKIKKEIENGRLFYKEKGIYSEKQYVPETDIITMKYPKAIFTFRSAFYYHGLTDVIPDHYYLATTRGTKKIKDDRVKQIFENSNAFDAGKVCLEMNGSKIIIYNRERMLVELVRNKSKLPFDYYKEIIGNYRKLIDELDIEAISEYAYALPKRKMVMDTLQKEVF